MLTKKLVTVARNNCCLPKKIGGLGLKNLKLFNLALLAKLTWKFMSNDSFVCSFLCAHFWASLRFILIFLLLFGWTFGPFIISYLLKAFRLLGTILGFVWLDKWLGVRLVKLLPHMVSSNTLVSSFLRPEGV